MAFSGSSEVAIRFPSVWFGILLVALVWRFTRQLGLQRIHPLVPLVAAALMAVNAFAVHYSREMRMYSMHMVLTLISTMLMVALQVHYYAGFVFVAQNLFVFSQIALRQFSHTRRQLAYWIVAQIALAATSVPWIVYARSVLFNYRGNDVRGAALWEVVIDLLGNYTISRDHPAWHLPFALVSGVLLVIGLWRLWRAGGEGRWAGLLLALYFAVPIVAGWLAAQGRPIYTARYFIATLTPFLVIVAVALAFILAALFRASPLRTFTLPRAASAVVTLAFLSSLSFALIYYFVAFVDTKAPVWHNFLRVIDKYSGDLPAEQLRPVLNYPNPVFTFYYDPRGEYVTLPYQPNDLEGAERVVREMKDAGVRRIFLQVFPSWWDQNGVAAQAISKEYTQVEEAWTGQFLTKVYARANPNELQPVDVTYSNGVQLQAALVKPDLKGHFVEVHLRWNGDVAKLSGSEKMFIHITPLGNPSELPAQLDLPLSAGDLTKPVCTFGIRLPEDMAAGQYQVRIGLYDPALPGALRLTTNEGKDAVEVAQFVCRSRIKQSRQTSALERGHGPLSRPHPKSS